MSWVVEFCEDYFPEVKALAPAVRRELLVQVHVLRQFGPNLGRPQVDTLYGSRHSNMKELRFQADGGVWRIAFAFDWQRHAVLLVGGSKAGVSSSRFYKLLIKAADSRFDRHLGRLQKEMDNANNA